MDDIRQLLEHIVNYDNASVDRRFSDDGGPSAAMHPVASRSTWTDYAGASWGKASDETNTRWNRLQQNVNRWNSQVNLREITTEQRLKNLRAEAKSVSESFEHSLDAMTQTLESAMNIQVGRPDLVAGSGSDVLLALANMFGGRIIGYDENGKAVEAALQDTIVLRDRDNKVREDDALEADLVSKLQIGGGKVVILPIASKTLWHRAHLQRAIRTVARYNARVTQNDKAVIILDAVQVFGRIAMKDYARYFSGTLSGISVDDYKTNVAAIVHTGSKAFGAMAHTGFGYVLPHWKKRFGQMLGNISKDPERVRTFVKQYHLAVSPLGTEYPWWYDLFLSQFRGWDNATAIANLAGVDALVGDTIMKIRAKITQILQDRGFILLDSVLPPGKETLPSIIAFEYPASIKNYQVDGLLTTLASNGVMVSGNMHQKVIGADGKDSNLHNETGQRDKLRIAISRAQVLDWPNSLQAQEEKLAPLRRGLDAMLETQ